jgi:hypothetical protein
MELLSSGTKHTVEQAKIDAARVVQASKNERTAAETSLARFSQSLNNQRKMEAAGVQFNAQTQNILAKQDSSVARTFVQRLSTAQQLGEATVAASAAGVGGSSVETYKDTLRLRAAVSEESALRAAGNDTTNATASKSAIIVDATASLQNDSFQPNFDYTQYIDHVAQKNLFGAFVAIGVASYFGGPAAGMATSDAIASGNRAANGDNAGAGAYLTSAANNAAQAYSNYNRSAPAPTQQTAPSSTSADLGTGLRAPSYSDNSGSGSRGGFWGTTESFNIK